MVDHVFVKVFATRIMRYAKKGKLSKNFFGPFEILDNVLDVSYRSAVPSELESA